jgi:hypothetical protein
MNSHSTNFLAARSRELTKITALESRNANRCSADMRQQVVATRALIAESRLILRLLEVSWFLVGNGPSPTHQPDKTTIAPYELCSF